jgi:hypothetical protein
MGKDTTKAASYLIACIILCCACKQKASQIKPSLSFYYWKTNLKITPFEATCLDSLTTKKLYLKFYDVVWNTTTKMPEPIAQISCTNRDSLLFKNNNCKFAIVPTVFITNETMFYLPIDSIQSLANKIYMLTINTIAANCFNSIAEYQLDCDWSAATKEKYFLLLQTLKKLYGQTPISATIRMHQIKYSAKTGIPPVNKGVLMCYNMGNIKAINTKNSILEIDEFTKYSANLKSYPLPLDVAYPIFGWAIWFKNNQFYKILPQLPQAFSANKAFNQNEAVFTCFKDTVVGTNQFEKGDVLRNESISKAILMELTQQLNKKLKNKPQNIIFYHLDSVHLTKFYPNVLQSICAPFYN